MIVTTTNNIEGKQVVEYKGIVFGEVIAGVDFVKDFVAGLSNFLPDKGMDEYELYDFLEERADYTKRYYPGENIFLVTGHTPTVLIPGWGKAEVYREHGHIALDCACVAGGKLAAFCVETEEVIYVDGM